MSQTFWKEIRKLNILDKLRNKITLPAFCVRCGEDNGSLHFTQMDPSGGSNNHYVYVGDYTGQSALFVSAFTIEAWIKFEALISSEATIFVQGDNSTFFPYKRIFIDGEGFPGILKLGCGVRKGSVESLVRTSENIPSYQWCHVAATYDGISIKLFINGIQSANSLAISQPLDSDASGNSWIGGFIPDTGFLGKISEVRFWNRCLSKAEIQYNKNHRLGKNSELKRYYRFNDGVYTDLLNLTKPVTLFNSSDFSLISDDYPPLITGASPLAAVFDVVAGQNISLKYPIKKPADAEFTLCVSYVNENDERVRYKLWDDILDIFPSPNRYRGQVLPSSFRFEVFGRDGAETAELSSDLDIYFSKISRPITQRDTTNVNLVTNPTIDNSLACPWGSAFPLTFTSEQFGTCAAPVAQNLAVMSDNLTVYGGTGGVAKAILTEDGGFVLEEGGSQVVTENQ